MGKKAERRLRRLTKIKAYQTAIEDAFLNSLRETGRPPVAAMAADLKARHLRGECPQEGSLISEAAEGATLVMAKALWKREKQRRSGT